MQRLIEEHYSRPAGHRRVAACLVGIRRSRCRAEADAVAATDTGHSRPQCAFELNMQLRNLLKIIFINLVIYAQDQTFN